MTDKHEYPLADHKRTASPVVDHETPVGDRQPPRRGWYVVRVEPGSSWEPAVYEPPYDDDPDPDDCWPWRHDLDDEFPRRSSTVAEWRGPYDPEHLSGVDPETIAGLVDGSLVAVRREDAEVAEYTCVGNYQSHVRRTAANLRASLSNGGGE